MTAAPTTIGGRPHRVGLFVVILVGAIALAAGLGIGYGFSHGSSSNTLEGSGKSATETRTVPAFTSVDLTGAANVSITIGSPQAVTVTADDNLVSYVRTTVESGTLNVGLESGSYSTKTDTHVDVIVPSLDAVTLSGAGNLTLTGVKATSLTLTLKGAGNLVADGTAHDLDAALRGTGDMQLGGLVATDARAEVSGTGRMVVHATTSLDATVSGTGAIVYTGSPEHVTTNVSGTGAITQG